WAGGARTARASGNRRGRAIVLALRARGTACGASGPRGDAPLHGYSRPPNSDRRLSRVQVVVR
ncbi:MAG: hypothetical protein AVDCRST_MAG04-1722, partial [uncultured Acetobacteraceae bacterium]